MPCATRTQGPTGWCASSCGSGRVRSGWRSATRAPASSRRVKAFSSGDTGGWGLLFVDRIADRWAVTSTATGTCVWFEIRYQE
jgi:hypothetical protein